jgi:hypothetical protein
MVASVTTAPFDLACATAIAFTPGSDGYVEILVNGVAYQVGDAVKTSDFYFSVDGGATARAVANIAIGDLLYLGSGITFHLDADDRISFLSVV